MVSEVMLLFLVIYSLNDTTGMINEFVISIDNWWMVLLIYIQRDD